MPARAGSFNDPIVLAGNVGYYPGFIPSEEADELFAALSELQWCQPVLRGMGPDSPMLACMSDSSSRPQAANKIAPIPWTPEAIRIKLLVEEKTGCAFDSLLLNLYRDHRDCLALGAGGSGDGPPMASPIATVSLGAQRRFKWENGKDGSTTTQLLEHGSLLLLPPGFQRDNRHELPKQEKPCGPRISLTFSRGSIPRI
jgi:alkylated DNA repair dioxygenase AlkB